MNKSTDFKHKLLGYKKLIDDDIDIYSKKLKTETLQSYGQKSRLATDAYLEILSRGGKRIRGALTILAYEMSGGKDMDMILKAARAIEMLHAYILIIDDIQDNSAVRRDGPTAHILLADYHAKNELAGDSKHFGLSIALNSALIGSHLVNIILTNLDVDNDIKNTVIEIVNETMLVTAHGQTGDILNEVQASVEESEVDQVIDWKTARYTFLNPLQVGMVLAGEDKEALNAIEDYAHYAGRAFQITDDILGTFGSEFESGKSPMDDIREGKRTILTVHALKNSSNENVNFLLNCLGDSDITPAEFEQLKKILVSCGALEYSSKEAQRAANNATNSLSKMESYWPRNGIEFLETLVTQFINRKN